MSGLKIHNLATTWLKTSPSTGVVFILESENISTGQSASTFFCAKGKLNCNYGHSTELRTSLQCALGLLSLILSFLVSPNSSDVKENKKCMALALGQILCFAEMEKNGHYTIKGCSMCNLPESASSEKCPLWGNVITKEPLRFEYGFCRDWSRQYYYRSRRRIVSGNTSESRHVDEGSKKSCLKQ